MGNGSKSRPVAVILQSGFLIRRRDNLSLLVSEIGDAADGAL